MKLLSTLAGLVAMSLCVSAANKPNIVFILADDLGYTDVACYGSKFYETPNIDRLAEQGMRFTDGYTCGPNCQPTRAALMSGQYMPRTGVYTVGSIDRFNWQSRPLRPVDNVTELPLEKITILLLGFSPTGVGFGSHDPRLPQVPERVLARPADGGRPFRGRSRRSDIRSGGYPQASPKVSEAASGQASARTSGSQLHRPVAVAKLAASPDEESSAPPRPL